MVLSNFLTQTIKSTILVWVFLINNPRYVKTMTFIVSLENDDGSGIY